MFIKYNSRPLYFEIDGSEFIRGVASSKDELDKYDFSKSKIKLLEGEFPPSLKR